MSWDTNLLHEQRVAAGHIGCHARVFAGPGTGKTRTLTRHICFLVESENVPSDRIFVITFTRATTRELRQRVKSELGEGNLPYISTLHSFALRQLLRNADCELDLPRPIRIADDWEERNIILEDIKSSLGLARIKQAKELLNELSNDWGSLTADNTGWEERFPNPRFIGFWQEHRRIYGYTLRAEMVYQLKKALQNRADFRLEEGMRYLLVDEYQDLNRCDLTVVRQIANRGVELFIAGDDDQSIYGFRKAHPQGIRDFPQDYPGCRQFPLELCKRCDRKILALALLVIRQDFRHIEKAIRPEPGRAEGQVEILRFDDQNLEAEGIVGLCSYLIHQQGLLPHDILILLRSDDQEAFSQPIRENISEAGIPVATSLDANPLDHDQGRSFVAFLRLATTKPDGLAWRTLFQNWCRGVGQGGIETIYDVARRLGLTFGQTVMTVRNDPSIIPNNHRGRLSTAIQNIWTNLQRVFPDEAMVEQETCADLMRIIRQAGISLLDNEEQLEDILKKFQMIAETFNAKSIEALTRGIGVSNEDIEQQIEQGKVNILTMHKAKGLTAKAVIVVAAEDQYIPGRAQGEAIDDERRLLYVSLTRAKHYLFATYCDRRTGQQRYRGRDGGRTARGLTQFLRNLPVTPLDGRRFVRNILGG